MTNTPSSLCLQRRWLWPSLLRRVEPTTTPQSAQGRERSQFSRRMIFPSIPVSFIPVIYEIMDPSLYHLIQYPPPVSVDLISNLASRTVHFLTPCTIAIDTPHETLSHVSALLFLQYGLYYRTCPRPKRLPRGKSAFHVLERTEYPLCLAGSALVPQASALIYVESTGTVVRVAREPIHSFLGKELGDFCILVENGSHRIHAQPDILPTFVGTRSKLRVARSSRTT